MKLKNKIIAVALLVFMFSMLFANNNYSSTNEPDWNSTWYNSGNPYTYGYAGQCTWYVWGRARELTGLDIGYTGAATGYWDGVNGSYERSQTPRENAIVCYGGHVAWVEAVNGNQITISECNYYNNTSDWIYSCSDALNRGQYDGRYTGTLDQIKNRTWGFKGFIYIGANPTPSAPKINWMTVNLGQSGMITDEVEIRVWAESSVGISGGRVKVWRSGPNPTAKTFSFTSSNYENGYYKIRIKGYDITGWVEGTANVCCFEAIAVDRYGTESSMVGIYDTPVGGIQDLGNFTARILPISNSNFTIRLTGDTNGSGIQLANKSTNDKYEMWKFEKVSGNYYEIKNVANNKVITSQGAGDSNGNPLIGWDDNNSAHAMFLIQKYNDGYRLILGSSGVLRAVDVSDGKIENGRKIQIWINENTQYNKAQTFKFDKLVTSINLNKTTMSLNVGNQETLSVTYTPTDATTKAVTWKSSDTSVATVTSTGVVKGIKQGTATITATTKDGMAIAKTCKVTVNKAITTKPFPDVELNKWYTNAVQYVKDNGLMSGYGKTTDSKHIKGNFGPDNTITRAEVASILYRMAGSPAVSGTTELTDIKNNTGKWYYKAVLWCNQNGIINGYGSGVNKGKFMPDNEVTRQDLAVMLTGYAKNIKGKSTSISLFKRSQILAKFSDKSDISSYAKNAVCYMVQNNVISGKENGTKIDPLNTAKRAEVAQMIMQFNENIK